MAAHDPPIGIDRDRHLRLKGRSAHMWERRGTLLIFAVVPILALFNVFGQASLASNANSPTASLSVDSPAHVRSGLMFTAQITVQTAQDVSDLQLTLDRGWFESITFNGIVPQPPNESAENGTIVFDFGAVPANTRFPVWLSLQANPTNVGRHLQAVTSSDGDKDIMTIHRTLLVFP